MPEVPEQKIGESAQEKPYLNIPRPPSVFDVRQEGNRPSLEGGKKGRRTGTPFLRKKGVLTADV